MSWDCQKWLSLFLLTWDLGLFVAFDDLYLGIVELFNQHVEGLNVVILVWIDMAVLSIDLKPMMGFLMLKTFWSQKDIRSSNFFWVLILIRLTLDRCLNDIINSINTTYQISPKHLILSRKPFTDNIYYLKYSLSSHTATLCSCLIPCQ